ncbi:lipopolysaccharide biosynthesis protein [Streptococcus phocae subsp. phocae]
MISKDSDITKLSERKNFIWNLFGSLSTAIISVIFLLVVSRLATTSQTDTFSFAYALGSLLVIIGLFQVRNYQATDIQRTFEFTTYFFARLVTIGIMIGITIIYLMMKDYTSEKSALIFLMILYRSTDAFSDVYQGIFQQHERLDLAGKSLFFRNMWIIVAFILGLFWQRNIIDAMVWVLIISTISILYLDILKARQFENIGTYKINWKLIFKLLRECFPLFINGFLLLYIYNYPKYVIDNFLEAGILKPGVQKDFNIIFMPTFVMNLLMLFFRPLITKMAIFFSEKKIHFFYKIQVQLFSWLLAIGCLVLGGSFVAGIPFLNMLYGVRLNDLKLAFMLLMVSGLLSSYAIAIDNILTVIRKQKLLIVSYLLSFLVTIIFSPYLVKTYSILGASIAFFCAMFIWLLSSLCIYLYIKRKTW